MTIRVQPAQREAIRPHGKVKDLDELQTVLSSLHGKKIVLCHGVFDLLHIGHMRYFEQAKRLGDVLVVTVTPDGYVNKGPGRPAFPEALRAEALAGLECVDYVAINRWPTAVETIRLLRPRIYAKGSEYRDAANDYTGQIVEEERAIRDVGGTMAFTEDITFSSSSLINRHFSAFPREVSAYLEEFRRRYSAGDVLRYLKTAHTLKVLVIGETIIDEYQFCEAIGKSAKEPVLATRHLSTEQFAGGILAVANHVAGFCDNVGLVTFLGDEASQEEWIRTQLKRNIEVMFLYKAHAPTIVKRRFIEHYLLQKLFEVYVMNDEMLGETNNRDLCIQLHELLPHFDAVIVADYGHGLLGEEAIRILCDEAKFLAVNTQSNAGNKGFNTISKYPRADYICLAQHEIALEIRDRLRTPRDMILDVSRKLSCGRVMLTRGKYGSVCYSEQEGFSEVPAFAQHVVDRMGAGDAVLSLTTLCVAQQAPMEVAGFIGNVVGAQAVATLGHRTFIERVPLLKAIESLLK